MTLSLSFGAPGTCGALYVFHEAWRAACRVYRSDLDNAATWAPLVCERAPGHRGRHRQGENRWKDGTP